MAGNISSELITPKVAVDELVYHLPETHIGMNVAGDVIVIRRLTKNGEIFERQVTEPDVVDYVVDKWTIFSAWGMVRGQ